MIYSKNKSLALVGSIILICLLAIADTSFWQARLDVDSSNNLVKISKNIPGSMDITQARNLLRNSVSIANSWDVANPLRSEDRDAIESRIDSIPSEQRLDFLTQVLGRIDILKTTITNSDRSDSRKANLVGLLEAIRSLIQDRIDSANNIWDLFSPSTWSVSTSTMMTWQTSSPVTNGFSVSSITSDSAVMSVTSTVSGTWYYIIIPTNTDVVTPTSMQITLWQDSNSQSANIKGSFPVVSGQNTFTIASLPSSTPLTVFFIVTDMNGNIQSPIQTATINNTTINQSISPVTNGFSIGSVTTNSAILSVTSSVSGTWYYVVMPINATAPTATQITMWKDSYGLPTNIKGSSSLVIGSNAITITALPSSTPLAIFFAAVDMNGNIQSTVQTTNFTTLSQYDKYFPTY
jgi:hypothetical protein